MFERGTFSGVSDILERFAEGKRESGLYVKKDKDEIQVGGYDYLPDEYREAVEVGVESITEFAAGVDDDIMTT